MNPMAVLRRSPAFEVGPMLPSFTLEATRSEISNANWSKRLCAWSMAASCKQPGCWAFLVSPYDGESTKQPIRRKGAYRPRKVNDHAKDVFILHVDASSPARRPAGC